MSGHESIQGGLVVAQASDIPQGTSRKFQLACGHKTLDGFVINFKGRFYAYINRCCHIPVPLDWTGVPYLPVVKISESRGQPWRPRAVF